MVVSVVHTHGGLFDEQPCSPYAIPCVSWDVLHGVLMKLYARIAFLIAKFRPFIYLVNLNGHIVCPTAIILVLYEIVLYILTFV